MTDCGFCVVAALSSHIRGFRSWPTAAWARVPAGDVEGAVVGQLRQMLRAPEVIVATWRAARVELPDLTEAQTRQAVVRLDPLWDELFPAEQARIVRLLVERVDIDTDGVRVTLRKEGLGGVATELSAIAKTPRLDRRAA